MNTSEEPVDLAGATLGEHRHIRAFFDLSKTRGDLIMDAMRTHPLVVLGGVLQVNPFFVPPDQFLRALRKRRSAGSEPASLG